MAPGVASVVAHVISKSQKSEQPADDDWLNADQTELVLPADFNQWDETRIDTILKKYPIQTLMFPPFPPYSSKYGAELGQKVGMILECLQKKSS